MSAAAGGYEYEQQHQQQNGGHSATAPLLSGAQEPLMGCGEVYLHVYDLVEQNQYMYWAGIGVYHSGVEVYGREYAYGGHQYDAPGVFATVPKQLGLQEGGGLSWREKIYVGRTMLDEGGVMEVIRDLGNEFKGNTYHLLQKNCNTFSSELCFRLTGNRGPRWVNRLADIAVTLHCLLPAGWVPPLKPPEADQEALVEPSGQRGQGGQRAYR